MDSSFSLLDLGLGFVILTAAFGFSLHVVSRYTHVGLVLLCASLGLEALASALSFLLVALEPGKSPFLLWSSGVLRYLGFGLLLGGWVLLAVSKKSIAGRDISSGPAMVSGVDFLRWGIVAVLVISVLATAWAFLLIFGAGLKTTPRITSQEALSAAVPSLVLLPASVAFSVFGVRWVVGTTFVAFGLLSCLLNFACIVLAAIFHWSP
jgi:hypothetical protein